MSYQEQYKRVVKKHTIILGASKEKIFPLLCPVRESEWLPGFSSKTIFSESGVSELDGIFLTHENKPEEAIWTIPIYQPNKFIEMIYFQSKVKIVIIKLSLTESSDNKTLLQVEYIYTSLSEKGNEQLRSITDDSFKNQINSWEICFNYLFKTGTRIPEELLMKHHR